MDATDKVYPVIEPREWVDPETNESTMLQIHHPGIDLRTYLAGMAMQGVISKGNYVNEETVGRMAVSYADVLIKALNETR